MKVLIIGLLVLLPFIDGTTPPASNVTVSVQWEFNSGINITVISMTSVNLKSSQYAAMGFGQNVGMGEAHVFICKRFANDTITIGRFVNIGFHTPPMPAGSEQGGVFTPLPSKLIDGNVICQFVLSDFSPETVKQLDILRPLSQSGNYHPIFAVGIVNATGDAQYHDGVDAGDEFVQLNRSNSLIFHQESFLREKRRLS